VDRQHAFHRLARLAGNLQLIPDMDAPDHQNAFLFLDLTGNVANEVFRLDRDPARCQRASKGAGESAAGRRHHIVQGRRMRVLLAHIDAVVLGDGSVNAERHWLRLRRDHCTAQRSANTLNRGPGRVNDI
jgi:hypothetical protein